ncbi:MAG: hypothetical protein LAQ69_15545 [Acidobacteriia bacterium]|nr:hypothetical protein [Terriglobia bacterium]
MARKFTLEVEVVVEDNTATKTLEVASERYTSRGGARVCTGRRRARPAAPEEFISGIEDGLLELLEQNPLFAEAGVEVTRVSCGASAASPARPDGASVECYSIPQDDLDEADSGLYLCRWPNGDFSIVKADKKRAAVVALDEWAGAEPSWLVPMDHCMIDFALNDDGEIQLAEFGEETADFVWDHCYPELRALLSGPNLKRRKRSKRNPETTQGVRTAVQRERERLWDSQGASAPANTALGKELQKRLRTTGPVADHYVEEIGNRILRGETGVKGKPN